MITHIYDQYTLKEAHKERHPNSHFFDHDTLKFFGETMSSMNLLKSHAMVKDYSGEMHECYVLSTRQRTPFGQKIRKYHYFDVNTLDQILRDDY